MRLPVDGDLALLHDLEQRRLGLRAGAVDLVGEDDVREHRAGVELERAAALVVDGDAGDVARQQVGRELHAVARAGDRLRHGARERGLARAGHVLEQQVALAEERREGEPHDPVLAEQHLLDRADEPVEVGGEPRRLLGGHRHRCSSLIGSSTGRSRRRPQHPTRPVRRPWRSGPGTSSPTGRRGVALPSTPQLNVAGRPELSGAAAQDQVLAGSSHARLGSANVRDGVAGRHDRRPRDAAPPHGAAAHLEPHGLAERAVEQVRSHPAPAEVGRLADLGAVGVDRDDLQARAATGVTPTM